MISRITSRSILRRWRRWFVFSGVALALTAGLLSTSWPATSAETQPIAGHFRQQQTPAPSQAKNESPPQSLEVGQPIERELAGGQTHTYLMTLAEGQFLRVVVEQRGIDVVATLLGPDGKQLIEVDSPNGAQGPELLSFITQADGRYRLEVRSLEKDAKPGRYQAWMAELRPATTADRNRILAEQALSAGDQLKAQPGAESQRQAGEKYEEARRLWQALGDSAREARALYGLGRVEDALGERQRALDYYNQALPLFRAAGDQLGEAPTLYYIGNIHSDWGDKRTALDYYERALTLLRAGPDRSGEAIILNNIGDAYKVLGEYQKSLAYYDQALQLARANNDRLGEAYVLTGIGKVYSEMGDQQKAIAAYRQALPLFRESKHQRGEGLALAVLGEAYDALNDYQQAFDSYHQALLALRAARDHRAEAGTLNNLGLVYYNLGSYQQALAYYDQALQRRRALGDRVGEAQTLGNIGSVHADRGDQQQALDYHQQGLRIRRATGDRPGEATALHTIGMTYFRQRDYQQALSYFNQALLIRREIGNREGEANTLTAIGGAYYYLGQRQQAIDTFQEALPLQRAVGARSGEAEARFGIAHVERDRDRFSEARAQIETAISIIESLRANVVSHELRSSYFASAQRYYEFYIDLLMRLYKEYHTKEHATAAMQASERKRARSLIELLGEARAEIRQGADPTLLKRERELQGLITGVADRRIRLSGNEQTSRQAEAAAKELEALYNELQGVEAQIRATSPRYAALTQPEPLTVAKFQRLLDANTLLLEYALGEERSYLWVVSSAGPIKSYELPNRATINRAAEKLLAGLTVPRGQRTGETSAQQQARVEELDAKTQAAAMELSQTLLAPAVAQLGKKRLVIVADGMLQYVPFAVLPKPGVEAQTRGAKSSRGAGAQPLIVGHEIVSLPSASTIAVLRRELAGRKPAPKLVAAFADPVFDVCDERVKQRDKCEELRKAESQSGATQTEVSPQPADLNPVIRAVGPLRDGRGIPRLRASGEEAESITRLAVAGMSKLAYGFEANFAAVKSTEMAKYRYAHFATHGLLNDQHSELSGILLSLVDEQGREQNGLLRLGEVYNLNLPAEVVTLSACQTALGKDVRGEGLVGLTRGFMYAGAARVVASLWRVEDEGTKELMIRFYRGMLKQRLRPAAALRQAQISMLREPDWRSPYYWGAFILQGEWR